METFKINPKLNDKVRYLYPVHSIAHQNWIWLRSTICINLDSLMR